MSGATTIITHWRASLEHSLGWFNARAKKTRFFYAKLILFFVVLNLACYWWALLTTYPQNLISHKGEEYVLMGFPVAVMGAMFDGLSLLITIYVIKRALASTSNASYMAFLSVDLLTAIAATFWILFAFVVSGWLVGFALVRPETMEARMVLYEGRLWQVFLDPLNPDNIRNAYFGIVMGASALLPTIFHAATAARAVGKSIFSRNLNLRDKQTP